MVGDDREERDRREPRREDEHRDAAAREGERRGGDADRRARRTWTPWLVIRYTSTDDGRGRPIPDNTVFWASPDIWVESSDPLGNPVVGEANFVHARVFNLGKGAGEAYGVDMFWMEPSIGPGSMNWLGSTWVEVPVPQVERRPVPRAVGAPVPGPRMSDRHAPPTSTIRSPMPSNRDSTVTSGSERQRGRGRARTAAALPPEGP
jgi:hypothetical protein